MGAFFSHAQTIVAKHRSVLADEVVEWLRPSGAMLLIDGTLGGGGHARLLAERLGAGGQVIAFDRDPAALEAAERELAGLPIKIVAADFSEIPEVLAQLQIDAADGIVLDLGISSDQLADPARGFSFDAPGPLDMRFNPHEGEAAWQLLQRLDERSLADLIYRYGEERHSRRIARRIVEARRRQPIRNSDELAGLVRGAVPKAPGRARIDPATRTFQALRIAVNDELGSLEKALARLPDCMAPGGRLAVISFHSLEDRRVKQAFRDDPRYEVLTRKPIRPSEAEIEQNPRARSAKLRVAARSDKQVA